MTKAETIDAFHAALSGENRAIADRLREVIDRSLPLAESRIWHAHPVWFLDENPIVGYSRLKDCIRLMFWSGQSFQSGGLVPTGSFKAAEKRYRKRDDIDAVALQE